MTISVGDNLPDATLGFIGENGPETVSLASLCEGQSLVIFGLPGAFTGTCTAAHLPSFIRNADAFRAKGVDHIVCISVNDPFVMKAWDEATGASAAGIQLLTDGDSSFTRAAGLAFSLPALGFIDRCKRFAAHVVNGRIEVLNLEAKAGVCELTAGETLLAQM